MKIFYLREDGAYTESIAEAASFRQYSNGDFVEVQTAEEYRLTDSPVPPSGRVWYECNGQKPGCGKSGCKYGDCRKTSDISSAVNFATVCGDYYEKGGGSNGTD